MSQTRKYELLRFICFATWCGLLIVGLWPFNFFPRNKVEWLRERNGIHFDWHGQIFSTVPWSVSEGHSGSAEKDSFSIEVWLQPDKVFGWISDILSMYDPARTKNFTIVQSGADLVVRGRFRDHNNRVGFRSVWLDGVFQQGRVRFVTVTSGPLGTALYLEGVRGKLYPYTPAANNLSGMLLLGHSSAGGNAWAGALLGLAIYHRALTPDEVSQHYKAWSEAMAGELAAEKGIVALYPFDERTGDRILNKVDWMPDLVIPKKFYILHRTFLAHSFRLQRSDVEDMAINILGFVPFGFLVSAYLYHAACFPRSKALLLTVIFGAMTSLIIECLQAYLPSRDSSLPDVINNILGTTLGTMAFKVRLVPDELAGRGAASP